MSSRDSEEIVSRGEQFGAVLGFKIVTIELDSALYQAERELRNEVLLRPIGIPDYGWEMKDDESFHIVALRDGVVVGCVLLWPSEEGRGQLMQMAVAEEAQGRGVGRMLVAGLVEKARERDLKTVFCHARADVVSFYWRLGFFPVGERFQEVGVDHQLMELSL